jgi:hypothetical protein
MWNLFATAALLLPNLRFGASTTVAQSISSSAAPVAVLPGHVADPATFKGSLAAVQVSSPATFSTGLYQPIGEVVVPVGEQFITRGAEEKDGYAYLLTRTDSPGALPGYLLTYDVSDLPVRTAFTTYNSPVSSRSVLNGNGLLRNGNYLYAYGYNGLVVLDIHNPANPLPVSTRYDLAIFNLVISSNYLVAPGYGGIAVYSIVDPSNPRLLSIYRDPGRYFYSAAVYANVLYTYEFELNNYSTYWLRILDLSNPSGLSSIHVISRNTLGYQLRLVGNKLIECGDPYTIGLWSLDVPANPVFQTSQPADARSCAVDDDTIVTNGEAFRVNGNGFDLIDTFNAVYDQIDGSPYGSALTPAFVFISQSPRILILKKNPLVHNARLDLGMPYPDDGFSRGCPSVYAGCGGPFHGFNLGVCTDLVLDTYTAGMSFDIQSALAQDLSANPQLYPHRTARNAIDMLNYFQAHQQFLPHSTPYQVGDIAFFDFGKLYPTPDDPSGHVLVVTQIDSNGRPTMMADASGTVPDLHHLNGLAWEHPWTSYYDEHVQGHGRLLGTQASPAAPSAGPVQALRVTVDSAAVALQLLDTNGKSMSAGFDDKFAAGNVEAFIPFIPWAYYSNLGSQQVITSYQPLSNASLYWVQLSGKTTATYHLRIETLQDSLVTDTQLVTQTINANVTQSVAISVTAPGGNIQFASAPPEAVPTVVLPSLLESSGIVGTPAQMTFTVSEAGGQQPVNGIVLSATNLEDQYAGVIPGGQVLITATATTIAPGGSMVMHGYVSLANIPPGIYLGALLFASINGGTHSIPLDLDVQPRRQFLPLIAQP